MRPDLDPFNSFHLRTGEPVASETELAKIPPKLRKSGQATAITTGPELFVFLGNRSDMPSPGKIVVPNDVAASADYAADPTSAAAAGRWFIISIASLLANGNFKLSVAAVATSNLAGTRASNVITETAANGALPTIDSYAPAVGDRLLLTAQTAPADNGIYTVTSLGSGSTKWVLTRATDADTSAEVVDNFQVYVVNGTLHGGESWTLHVGSAITLNTTGLTFYRVSQTGLVTLTSGVGPAIYGVAITKDSQIVYEPITPGGTMGAWIKSAKTVGAIGTGTFISTSITTAGATQTLDTSIYRYRVLN